MIDIARNIVPCSDKQDMKSRNGSYFQPSFSTRKRQRISSDLFSELPQKRSKTTNGRIWNKTTYSFSSQTLCTISSKVIRMWASLFIFVLNIFFICSLPFGLTAVIFIGKSSNVISCLSLNSFTKSNISILMYHLFRDTSRTFCINFHIALSPAFADIFSRPWLIFLYSTIKSSTYSFFHLLF